MRLRVLAGLLESVPVALGDPVPVALDDEEPVVDADGVAVEDGEALLVEGVESTPGDMAANVGNVCGAAQEREPV